MPEIKIYNQDCLEAMAKMPDKAYELAITDPIYGIKEPAFRRTAKNKATECKIYKCLS